MKPLAIIATVIGLIFLIFMVGIYQRLSCIEQKITEAKEAADDAKQAAETRY